MDRWGPKHVELTYVMNKLIKNTLCVLLDCICITRWYTVPTMSRKILYIICCEYVAEPWSSIKCGGIHCLPEWPINISSRPISESVFAESRTCILRSSWLRTVRFLYAREGNRTEYAQCFMYWTFAVLYVPNMRNIICTEHAQCYMYWTCAVFFVLNMRSVICMKLLSRQSWPKQALQPKYGPTSTANRGSLR